MRTSVFLNPKADHQLLAELEKAQKEHEARYPDGSQGHFYYLGESWNVTSNGLRLTIPRSIRELPLVFEGVPIHLIELEDTVENLNGANPLQEGIYEAGDVRAEVDSFVYTPQLQEPYLRYTIKIEGDDLKAINDLYAKIRQHQVTPTDVWDVVAPNN